MSAKSLIVQTFVPKRAYRFIERRRNIRELRAELHSTIVQPATESLMPVDHLNLDDIFRSPNGAILWQECAARMEDLSISESAGGINPGDRRALYQLMRHLKPRRILEVGTHIGASTVYLADAIKHNENEANGSDSGLVTVDIIDVNDEEARPWENAGEALSPIAKLRSLQLDNLVKFVARSSLDYLRDTQATFDLIFLDGDHSAKTVYKELPVALACLNDGGCVVMHDYFPDGKPLWSNGAVVSGPFLAIERLRAEGLQVSVRPLGELPWECKLGSGFTSLALVGA